MTPACASHYNGRQRLRNVHHNIQSSVPRTRDTQDPSVREDETACLGNMEEAFDVVDEHRAFDGVDSDAVPVFDDDFPNEDVFVDSSSSDGEGEDDDDDDDDEHDADRSVYDFYKKLVELRANPHDLARFSCEEKVHIELLQLVRDLKAPLKAFNLILNWAAKSNESGHIFHVGPRQPTHKKVMKNLYDRYNTHALIPKEKQLYLPYSQQVVKVVDFDASAVFASLLSCPTINRDESFLFHDERDPAFVAPNEDNPSIGDIITGRCYIET